MIKKNKIKKYSPYESFNVSLTTAQSGLNHDRW